MSNVNFDHIMRSVAGASQRVCQPAQHVRSGAKAAKVAAEKTMEDRKKIICQSTTWPHMDLSPK